MKTKGSVFIVLCITMAAGASAQKVTTRQEVAVKAGVDLQSGKEGAAVKTESRVAQSGELTAQSVKGSGAASGTDVQGSQSAGVDVRPAGKAVREEVAAAGEKGAAALQQVTDDVAVSANTAVGTSLQVQESVKAETGRAAGSLQTAAGAALEGGLNGGLNVREAGRVMPEAGARVVKPLVNGSLKGGSVHASGDVKNTIKINAAPVKAQLRSMNSGRITVL